MSLKLPSKKKPGDPVKASDFNSVLDALRMLTLMPGVGYLLKRGLGGTALEIRGVSKGQQAVSNGPFCKVYVDAPIWRLLGGTITGGIGTETLSSIGLATVGAEPANGTFHWLIANVTATVEDDVLLPGCDLTSVSTDSGATVPNNTIPTASSPTGILNVSLGEWMGGKFIPAGCGNLQISHCPGSLSVSRGVTHSEFF